MILAAILLGVILIFICLFIVFLNFVLLPSITKEKESLEDPVLSYAEKNYIELQSVELKTSTERAYVLCNCKKSFSTEVSKYNENYTCFVVKSIQDSPNDCKYACIGLGDCVKVCPQQAISIVNNTAVISDLCCGCGKCADICPQNIIKLIPKNTKTVTLCSNTNTENLTSCTTRNIEENAQWNVKKDFKIWAYCYKIIKMLRKNS